jgi:hypothetical protein
MVFDNAGVIFIARSFFDRMPMELESLFITITVSAAEPIAKQFARGSSSYLRVDVAHWKLDPFIVVRTCSLLRVKGMDSFMGRISEIAPYAGFPQASGNVGINKGGTIPAHSGPSWGSDTRRLPYAISAVMVSHFFVMDYGHWVTLNERTGAHEICFAQYCSHSSLFILAGFDAV